MVSNEQSLGNLDTSTTLLLSVLLITHTSTFTGLLCGNIVKLKLQTSLVTKAALPATVTHTFWVNWLPYPISKDISSRIYKAAIL